MVYLSDAHFMIYNIKTKKLVNYKNTISNPRIYKKCGFALTNFAERYMFVSGGYQTIPFSKGETKVRETVDIYDMLTGTWS